MISSLMSLADFIKARALLLYIFLKRALPVSFNEKPVTMRYVFENEVTGVAGVAVV